MSRMTTAQALERPSRSPEAAAIVAVMQEMRNMDQRWGQWRTEMVDRLKEADALITGLHQDNANLTVRMHALMRWAHKHWATFDTEIQTEYVALLAEIEQVARDTLPDVGETARQEEHAHEESADDHLSVPVE